MTDLFPMLTTNYVALIFAALQFIYLRIRLFSFPDIYIKKSCLFHQRSTGCIFRGQQLLCCYFLKSTGGSVLSQDHSHFSVSKATKYKGRKILYNKIILGAEQQSLKKSGNSITFIVWVGVSISDSCVAFRLSVSYLNILMLWKPFHFNSMFSFVFAVFLLLFESVIRPVFLSSSFLSLYATQFESSR